MHFMEYLLGHCSVNGCESGYAIVVGQLCVSADPAAPQRVFVSPVAWMPRGSAVLARTE
jgi:hypothetical protein